MDPAELLYSEAFQLQAPIKAAQAKGDSIIQEWYSGKTAFITGGSGYLGKLLIEKLISSQVTETIFAEQEESFQMDIENEKSNSVRSCNLKKIYILVRDKKGKTMKDRLKEFLSDPLYRFLHDDRPDFTSIIHGIQGDVAELGLGISNADRQTLVQEVDVIFHLAATTRFDEVLSLATLINVRGTRELLALARECQNLKSVVQVSTAFTHATRDKICKEVSEEFYQSPVGPDALIKLVETTDERRLLAITKDLISGWPNTYAFTKAVSEELVRAAGDLPVCVFRPAIVLCPYYEPEPGYVDMSCAFGTSGIVIGVGLGVLRVFFIRRKVRLCYVPADLSTNATIVCGWKTAISRDAPLPPEPKIYTLSSSKCNIGFYVISDVLNTKGRAIPTPKSLWYNFLIETDNVVYYKACVWLLHYFPAYIADFVCKLINYQLPKGIKSLVYVYTKIDKMSSVYSYYLTNEWDIRDDNLAALYESLPPTDKDLFCFDVMKIDWERLILLWAIGIRRHICKDGLKDTNYAIKKQACFKVLNYAVLLLFIYFIWTLFSLIVLRFV